MINGEEIITTVDHPFYVNDRGFVNAGELAVGDELLDSNKNILLVENFDVELTDEPVKVYNFEVEDFHTYHVCTLGVLVHNAGKNYASLEPDKYTELTQSEVKDILKELGLEGIFDGCIYDRLTDAEMASMGLKANAPACEFSIGDSVVVKSGVWEDTTGIVRQINHEDRMVTINIDMFGRETPVEISFNDVEIV